MRHLSSEVQPGQKLALVGRTGSGKSTVAKRLLGLYEHEEGEIRLDGSRCASWTCARSARSAAW